MSPNDLYSDAGLIPEECRRLNEELRDNEQLLWVGRPAPTFCTLKRLLPLPATWLMAGLWGYGLWQFDAQIDFEDTSLLLFLLPFHLLLIVIVALGFSGLWEARQLRHSVYAVTSGRSIALEKTLFGFRKRIRQADAYLYIIRREDGSGDIIYEEEVKRNGESIRTVTHGFKELPDVAHVEALLTGNAERELARKAIAAATAHPVTAVAPTRRAHVALRLLLPIGMILFGFGCYQSYRSWDTEQNHSLTMGTVIAVEIEESLDSESGTTLSYRPVFSYTVNGTSYRTASPIASTAYAGCCEGDRMELYYDPAEPSRIRPNDFASLWFMPLLLLSIGGGFIGIAVTLLRRQQIKAQGGTC